MMKEDNQKHIKEYASKRVTLMDYVQKLSEVRRVRSRTTEVENFQDENFCHSANEVRRK